MFCLHESLVAFFSKLYLRGLGFALSSFTFYMILGAYLFGKMATQSTFIMRKVTSIFILFFVVFWIYSNSYDLGNSFWQFLNRTNSKLVGLFLVFIVVFFPPFETYKKLVEWRTHGKQ